MILDYEETRRLLKGTPLEVITDDQLKDIFIGEYPLLFGSKQLERIWDRCVRDERYEVKELRLIEAETILSHFKTLSISKGSNDTSNKLESVISLLNSFRKDFRTICTQAEIIKHQEKEILRYEIKAREQAQKIARLEKGL